MGVSIRRNGEVEQVRSKRQSEEQTAEEAMKGQRIISPIASLCLSTIHQLLSPLTYLLCGTIVYLAFAIEEEQNAPARWTPPRRVWRCREHLVYVCVDPPEGGGVDVPTITAKPHGDRYCLDCLDLHYAKPARRTRKRAERGGNKPVLAKEAKTSVH